MPLVCFSCCIQFVGLQECMTAAAGEVSCFLDWLFLLALQVKMSVDQELEHSPQQLPKVIVPILFVCW